MNTESKRTLLYPNIILAFSFFYFSYIIEQETEDLIRRLCYGIFLLLDVLVLVYLNSKTYLFLQVQEKVSSLFGGLFQKQKTKEEKDEIKELVDKALEEDFKSRRTTFTPQGYYTPRYVEQEMFNPSHTNIDERFISNKIASPSAPSGFKSFSDNTAYSRLNPMLNNLTNEMQFEDISTRLLKNFQLSNKYKKKLLEYFANQYQVDSDIEKYKMYNFEFWMDEFKRFLLNNLIPTMVQDHNENLDHLNNFFENSLNMQIVSYIVDDVDLDNFRKYMSGVIFDPNLKFKNYNRDMLKTGGGDNTLSYSARDGSYNKPNEDRLKIFFGDEEKLSFILALIEQKLNNLRKMNTQKIASTLFAKQGKENVNISNDSLDRQHLNNPFLIRSSQGLTDYDDMMLLHNTNFEENLKHLKKLLVLRMEINDKLKNYFIKEESNKHSQLIMEYNIWRLNDFIKNGFAKYSNNSGGNYKEMWVSALPTDSQLLSSITVNYLEDVYRETKIAKAFLINWPLQPKLEKGSNSIMLYQINPPSTEPHFNVVFQDNLIQCYSGKENFFFSMVVFLFIMRTQFTEMMKNLHLDDFVNSIIKI